MDKILIATIKSWNIDNAAEFKKLYRNEMETIIINNNCCLNLQNLKKINPKYIFFPHWSFKIPKEIYERYECVIFHTGNLPHGRGGSPIQNHIVNKVYDTKICALRVVEELDKGYIYIYRNVNLSEGNADEMLKRMSDIIFKEMIPEIVKERITPLPQIGEGSYFKRRTEDMSNLMLENFENVEDIYDFIRMLDGEGYPKAFINLENFKIELSKVSFRDGKMISGKFEVKRL